MGAVDNSEPSFENANFQTTPPLERVNPRISSPMAKPQDLGADPHKTANQGSPDDSGDGPPRIREENMEDGSLVADNFSTASTAVEDNTVDLQQLVQ